MSVLALKLKPRGAWHLGERGVGVEETAALAHSDTLFSALCNAWLLRYDITELLEPFINGEPPFIISSALPYAQEVYFLPKPALPPRDLNEDTGAEIHRQWRKVRFVSDTIFQELVNRKSLQDDWKVIQQGEIAVTPAELKEFRDGLLELPATQHRMAEMMRLNAGIMLKAQDSFSDCAEAAIRLWEITQSPHVGVDRMTSAANIYHVGDVTFAPECGSYVLVRFLRDEAKWRDKLLTVFRLLGDEGLGGRRATGRGQFKIEIIEEKDFKLPVAKHHNGHVMTLSLLNPKDHEETETLLPKTDDDIAYELIMRRGWVYSPQARNLWRKGVMMLREGAVLHWDQDNPPGRLVKVLDKEDSALSPQTRAQIPHDVYRYGYGFVVQIGIGGNAE